MVLSVIKKIFSLVLIASITFGSLGFVFSQKAYAQGVNIGSGANLNAGANLGGIGATIVQCTGLADKLASVLDSIFGGVTEVPVGDGALRKKESCFDAIARFVVVKIMDKMTLATVNWINSGFEGSPLFVEDPEKFFSNIAKEEINKITAWYPEDLENYPFGRLVTQTILLDLQRQFAQNVRFSLNEVLAHGTYDEFRVDFNVGGWAGYTAMFRPNNNPLGNYIMVNNEIGRRISGTHINVTQNFQKQLQQSGGFLNQRKCELTGTGDPSDIYIPADDPLHVPSSGVIPDALFSAIGVTPGSSLANELQPGFTGPLSPQAASLEPTIQDFALRSQCKTWRTITPGKTVSDQLTKALNLPADQLLLADEFNEDLALIFDALLLQLVNTGLSSLDSINNPNPGTNVLLAQVQGQQPGQVANGNAAPPPQDAITGTGQSTITSLNVQQDYIVTASASGGAVNLLNELITKIRALDYCVPGPNPKWIQDGEQNLLQVLAAVPQFVSTNPDPNDAQQENEDFYEDQILNLTGVDINQGPAMDSYNEFFAFIQNVFNQYVARMQDTTNNGYNLSSTPPSMRPVLVALIDDMAGYEQDLAFVNNYLNNINSYLPILTNIESQLDNLAANNGGVLDLNDPNVQAQLSLYNSISSNLVTENQLSTLQAQIPVYSAQISLINSYLDSCVGETVNQPYPFPDQRVNYPTPIFPYVQPAAPFTALPAPDVTFLPGVDFGNGANDIDVEFGGVTVSGASNGLADFEAVLQSVY